MGVGPDPAGSVSATYTGRSTAYQVLRAWSGMPAGAAPGAAPASLTRNHCTSSTTCSGAPTTKSLGRSRPQRRITGSVPDSPCQAAVPAGVGSTVGARRKSPSCSGRPSSRAPHSGLLAWGAGTDEIATGGCSGERWRAAAIPSTVINTDTATTTAAMSSARGGPSVVCGSVTPPTLWLRSVGDREGQRPRDSGDLLHTRDHVGLQGGERVRADAQYYVVGSGDVLCREHPRQRRECIGDDLGAAHLGLDQHVSLHHPQSPPLSMNRLTRRRHQRYRRSARCSGHGGERQEGIWPARNPVGALRTPSRKSASSWSSTGWSPDGCSPRRWRSDRATMPRSYSPVTAAPRYRSTCWCRTGTSGWTGRRRMTSAARRSPRTPPTSKPWAVGPRRSWWPSARPRTPPARRRSNSPTGCGTKRAGWGRASS